MRRQCCLPMTENPEASVLTAKRAPQHIRLSRANDAYEHLCILTLLSRLAPLHLMLADTPWPHGFGATLANVGPLSEGFERSVASPLQPRRLCAMGRTSDRFPPCQTIIPTAFRSQSGLPVRTQEEFRNSPELFRNLAFSVWNLRLPQFDRIPLRVMQASEPAVGIRLRVNLNRDSRSL